MQKRSKYSSSSGLFKKYDISEIKSDKICEFLKPNRLGIFFSCFLKALYRLLGRLRQEVKYLKKFCIGRRGLEIQRLHWLVSSFVLDPNHGPKILPDAALDRRAALRPSSSTDVDKQPGLELSFSAFLLRIFSKLKPGFLSTQLKEEIQVWAHGFALQIQNTCV